MVLNYIWIAFFIIAFIVGLVKLLAFGDANVFPNMVQATFDMARTSVIDIAIPLAGVMTLWLGLMNIGEKAGAINFVARIVGPFFTRLFPGVPKEHPAGGHIIMNFSANMLGLDNAATPLGLKAMQSLQELNPHKETASNAQIMFLVLNTSGLTLIPVSIMAIRATEGAANPTDIFVPILLATFCSTLGGLIFVAIRQRINLFQPVVLSWLLGISAIVFAIGWYFSRLSGEELKGQSQVFSTVIILCIIIAFLIGALRKRVNAFDAFIEGAKGGFETSIKIIPYLVGILVGIAVFRASGAMGFLLDGIVSLFSIPLEVANALPTALMKPLSGSGARGMMIDAIKTYGVDSFPARLAGVFQGAADTTFYIVALYFGSVGIKHTRYSIAGGLFADLCGVIAAIFIAYLFFGETAGVQKQAPDIKIIMSEMKHQKMNDSSEFRVAVKAGASSGDMKIHTLWIGDTAMTVNAVPPSAFDAPLGTHSFKPGDTLYLVSKKTFRTLAPALDNSGKYRHAIMTGSPHFHTPIHYEGVGLIEYTYKGQRKYLVIEKWD